MPPVRSEPNLSKAILSLEQAFEDIHVYAHRKDDDVLIAEESEA